MSGKKFRFSLDSVLKLRSHEADCARQELAQIRLEIEHQERSVETARDALKAAVEARTTGSTGQRTLLRREAYRQAAYDALETERRRLDRLKEREHQARIQLLQRKGAEETIQRLREQEHADFWKEFRSAETERLDEQAISDYQRQRRTAN